MRLVILDRDGVINEDSDEFIKSPAEWVPIPGALEAVARLNNAGYCVAVATNQSGIARGLMDVDAVNAIHQCMRARIAAFGGRVDLVAFCPHGPDDGCDCRKPKAGLLREVAQRFGASLTGVPVIGDSLRDIDAARSVGAFPILVRTGKGRTLANPGNVLVVEDLAAAADIVLSR